MTTVSPAAAAALAAAVREQNLRPPLDELRIDTLSPELARLLIHSDEVEPDCDYDYAEDPDRYEPTSVDLPVLFGFFAHDTILEADDAYWIHKLRTAHRPGLAPTVLAIAGHSPAPASWVATDSPLGRRTSP